VRKRVALSYFNSQKATLYEELKKFELEICKHPLLNTLFYNEDQSKYDANKLDRQIPSDKYFSLFSCDASQLNVIMAAKTNKNIVIQGPPWYW
jgi:hypothetical protein